MIARILEGTMMRSTTKRDLIRFAGFAAGILLLAIWKRPWEAFLPSDQMARVAWLVIGGVVGVIVVEPFRRAMADQQQLDRGEEDALTEDVIRSLRRNRRLGYAIPAAVAVTWVAYSLGRRHWTESPGFCLFMVCLALLGGLFLGELALSLDRRQALYTRIVVRRRNETWIARWRGRKET